MGVYAKGKEMPKTCHSCELMECTLDLTMTVKEILRSRHPNCPLVEIPEPHGRLIDEDEILQRMPTVYYGSAAHLAINSAETLIEAEGE